MNSISLVGNLTADPRLTPGAEGRKSRVYLTVAVNEGEGDNAKTHFLDVVAFGTLAENVASSLHKGQRVVVVGRVSTYKREQNIDGKPTNVTKVEFAASAIGPDLRWAVARVAKVATERDGSVPNSAPASESSAPAAEAAPAPAAVAAEDEF